MEGFKKEQEELEMKKSNKYNYIEGKQITDPDTGKRVYEISSYRLPSVTTILGATKNTEFLKMEGQSR